MARNSTQWSIEQAADLYGIHRWGEGYFDISPSGDLLVKPLGNRSDKSISLPEITRDLASRNLNAPVLLRFDDLLATQITRLNGCFAEAIHEAEYGGEYRAVYPIKVNQRQHVIRDIVEFGRTFRHGLEAGSKAELVAAVANANHSGGMIICNGYKDREFIDLAIHATRLGLETYIVIEMPAELDLVIQRCKELAVTPRLGLRTELSTTSGGRWDKSSGDQGKFGMTAPQLVDAMKRLRDKGMLDCLHMLHYHIGSQVPDITRIRNALKEAARIYVELAGAGAPMRFINIGGGLALDYTGLKDADPNSRNYTLKEYAADVVDIVKSVADKAGIAHPGIVSESGRATVAHHSLLIFDVLHVRSFRPRLPGRTMPPACSESMEALKEVDDYIRKGHLQEAFNDAVYYRDQIRQQFLTGGASLEEKAFAEDLFRELIEKIASGSRSGREVSDQLKQLDPSLPDIYYGNFSLFQSLPDAWAIDQVFPVMPIHRLEQEPTRRAVIADITCDSDGMLNCFAQSNGPSDTLRLHELDSDNYYLGAFLTGAYQETLGDMHNLLGEINVVHIRIDDSGKTTYKREIPGASVADVLENVGYMREDIKGAIRASAEEAKAAGRIDRNGEHEIVADFEAGIDGYTYFER
jgi:arginine decarboxylase